MANAALSRLPNNVSRAFHTWSSMRFSQAVATQCPGKAMDPGGEAIAEDNDNEGRKMLLSNDNIEPAASHGASILASGGIIATPTDTVYGIAGDAQNNEAISKIYQIKGRIATKPIAICVSKIDQVYRWGKVIVPRALLQDLLPGPVTLVFERQPELNPNLNPNTSLIGIRIPNHKFIRSLAEIHGGPVALTSANFSNQPSTLAVHEFRDMWSNLQWIFDGGRLSSCEKSEAAARAGSTVIDLSIYGQFRIIREGMAGHETTLILKNKYRLHEAVS